MSAKDVLSSSLTACIPSPPASTFAKCIAAVPSTFAKCIDTVGSQFVECVGGDFVHATFNDAAGVLLQNHAGEVGATFTKHPQYVSGGDAKISNAKRVYGTLAAPTAYFASGVAVPATADYMVQTLMRWLGAVNQDGGVCGRMDTVADTLYLAWYDSGQFSPFVREWQLWRFVAGSGTKAGAYGQTLAIDTDYTLGLRMRGSDVRLFVDNVERIQYSDPTPITPAGRAGLRFFNIGSSSSDTAGLHLDKLIARPLAA